jgi:hypothetical protein
MANQPSTINRSSFRASSNYCSEVFCGIPRGPDSSGPLGFSAELAQDLIHPLQRRAIVRRKLPRLLIRLLL